ncbi:MAG TPA: TlpA disulfide reductase family protein, partial [Bacteroidales bacterium]|nr:TlpA disulfide reductase family protein [Bacteroidales bacterium]
TCVNENSHSELQTRIENLRRLAIGKQAPEIKITQKSGNTFTIGNIEQEYVLVLFWASWCPHCEDMIPQIKKVYQDNSLPGFEVLAVSIDTNVNEYSAALAKLTTAWINHCDFKGWDTQAAIDYSIYATPTMFLLGNDRTILARPVNAYELRNELSRLK